MESLESYAPTARPPWLTRRHQRRFQSHQSFGNVWPNETPGAHSASLAGFRATIEGKIHMASIRKLAQQNEKKSLLESQSWPRVWANPVNFTFRRLRPRDHGGLPRAAAAAGGRAGAAARLLQPGQRDGGAARALSHRRFRNRGTDSVR
jgi:hypothetical protein